MGVMMMVVEVWVMCGQRGGHRRQRSLLETRAPQDRPLPRHETVITVAPYGPVAVSRAVGELRVHGELGLRLVHAQTRRVAIGDLRHVLRGWRRVGKLCIQGSIVGGTTILAWITAGVTATLKHMASKSKTKSSYQFLVYPLILETFCMYYDSLNSPGGWSLMQLSAKITGEVMRSTPGCHNAMCRYCSYVCTSVFDWLINASSPDLAERRGKPKTSHSASISRYHNRSSLQWPPHSAAAWEGCAYRVDDKEPKHDDLKPYNAQSAAAAIAPSLTLEVSVVCRLPFLQLALASSKLTG
ncbi:hypothetical protein FQN60_018125 [Etheostoma spectabile]|uniref:Uncharacterized protein n=1 Tax=Etheostoma spectabile TaxID=54343 RepID=A0A5J5DHI0_9PERO|nr:hypothetical protein FQN60_018125 [Etheostoma spectabile]